MTAITDYRNFISVELPGCPNPLIDDAVLRTIREFLVDSEAWLYSSPTLIDFDGTQLDLTALVVGTDIPTDSEAVRAKSFQRTSDGCPIDFKTDFQLREYIEADWQGKAGSRPTYYTHDEPLTITFYPTPSTAVVDEIRAKYVLTIPKTATTFPDWIDHRWQEELQFGAMAKLLRIPGKDWTDMGLAGQYDAPYRMAIKEAKSKSMASFNQPRRSVRYGGY